MKKAKQEKFEFIGVFSTQYDVATLCSALNVTRAGFYAYRKRGLSAHDRRDLELARKIGEIYEQSRGIYGSPKIYHVLIKQGEHTSHKRVARIMADYAWVGITRRCATRPGTEKRDSHPDLIRRNFKADKPNRAWFADITYVKTHQGWLYLAIVMDIWSRKIVGWSMDKTMTAALADDALKMAIARRNPDKGCIHHSDHGSQYVSLLLGKTMGDNGIAPSMGAIQSPWDNAATESLMGIIKSECVHAKTFASREEATLEIFEYIECFYNKIRIHSALGWMSPNEFEEKMLLAA